MAARAAPLSSHFIWQMEIELVGPTPSLARLALMWHDHGADDRAG
jgi:hypothetical protein